MSVIVGGKLLWQSAGGKNEGYAEIELPEIDPSKFKEGDRVWVEAIIHEYENGSGITVAYPFSDENERKYIAHFPKEEKKDICVDCGIDVGGKMSDGIVPRCFKCFEKHQKTECKLPEKYPKEGEELRDSMCVNKLAKNVNQIIEYLKEKEKKA